jgi:hypothetical protein
MISVSLGVPNSALMSLSSFLMMSTTRAREERMDR